MNPAKTLPRALATQFVREGHRRRLSKPAGPAGVHMLGAAAALPPKSCCAAGAALATTSVWLAIDGDCTSDGTHVCADMSGEAVRSTSVCHDRAQHSICD